MRSKLHRALSPQKCKFHRTFCHLTILGCGHARPADYSIIESKSKDGFNWWAFLDQIKFREGRRLAEISPVWQHLHWPHSVWILRPEETPNRPAVFSISLCSSQQLLVVRTIGVCRPLGVVSCWRARFDMLTWSGAGYTHPLVARRNQKKVKSHLLMRRWCTRVSIDVTGGRHPKKCPKRRPLYTGRLATLDDIDVCWLTGHRFLSAAPLDQGGGARWPFSSVVEEGKKKCRRSVSVAADWSYQLLTRVEQLWRIGKWFFFFFLKKNTRLTVADLFSAYCRVTARARCTRVSYINQRKRHRSVDGVGRRPPPDANSNASNDVLLSLCHCAIQVVDDCSRSARQIPTRWLFIETVSSHVTMQGHHWPRLQPVPSSNCSRVYIWWTTGQMKEGKCLTGLLVVQLGRVVGLKLPQKTENMWMHTKMNRNVSSAFFSKILSF